MNNDQHICHLFENYLELKTFLKENGFIFYSETDSEIIVNLIEYYYSKNVSKSNVLTNIVQDSIYLALNDCIGTWGLVIQNLQEPDKLYAIKKGSPLLLGKSSDMSIITSEVSGFDNLINNYCSTSLNIFK